MSAYSENTHQVATPWSRKYTVATNKRRWVPFPRVTRSIQVRTDQSADVFLEFGPNMAGSVRDVEHPLSDTDPYIEQEQIIGVWLVNRSGGDAIFWVKAVLGTDDADSWPVYTAANGYESTDVAAAAGSDVTL